MKKNEKLFDAMGQIDERYIAEALEPMHQESAGTSDENKAAMPKKGKLFFYRQRRTVAAARQQVTDFLDNGRMETTVTRAKEIKPLAEKMITLGKKGDLAAYRQALSFITRETVAHKLFKEIAPEYAQRNGGYTRIIRTGVRRGDAAETAIIELVK